MAAPDITFVGPTLLSGIGQHTEKYRRLVAPDKPYYSFDKDVPECEHIFLFIIPIPEIINRIDYYKSRAKKVSCMTVCETEPVHESYGLLTEHFETIFVPSAFCQRVLSKQFPLTTWKVVHAHVPQRPYTFYHIGNILDDRKQFRDILEAFVRLNKPDTRLLVKCTANQEVRINIPRVEVVNGLLSEEQLGHIHARGDCYVSFSKSEGVGMGAYEAAAVWNKPVIITDWGGAPEYIKTPYTIECEPAKVEKDDFLFVKNTEWGRPNKQQLYDYMLDAYTKRVTWMDHDHSRKINDNVLHQFLNDVVGGQDDETR